MLSIFIVQIAGGDRASGQMHVCYAGPLNTRYMTGGGLEDTPPSRALKELQAECQASACVHTVFLHVNLLSEKSMSIIASFS
jgi:hypothetical protein